jgi:hypothetical protein
MKKLTFQQNVQLGAHGIMSTRNSVDTEFSRHGIPSIRKSVDTEFRRQRNFVDTEFRRQRNSNDTEFPRRQEFPRRHGIPWNSTEFRGFKEPVSTLCMNLEI